MSRLARVHGRKSKLKLAKQRLRPVHCPKLVRLGNDEDGGYVVPIKQVRDSKYLLSLGIDNEVSFDVSFVKENDRVEMIGVDDTVDSWVIFRSIFRYGFKSVFYYAFPGRKEKQKRYKGLFLRYYQMLKFFRMPTNRLLTRKVGSRSQQGCVCIADLVAMFGEDDRCNLFLKMDIEGAEYEVTDEIIEQRCRINCVVAEFHDLDTNTQGFNESFKRLNRHFYCIHVHGNNFSPYSQEHDFPCVIEITFLNKSLFPGSVIPVERSYPIAQLDFACNPVKADYPLDFESQPTAARSSETA